MKFRANLNLALVGGAFAAVLAVVPGVSAAGGTEGAWGQFHNSHVSAGGAVPSGAGISGAWDGFHQSNVGEGSSVSSSFAGGSLQNPWDRFHQSHTNADGADRSRG
ncbi:MAG TPA: hypothetical protein VF104_12495 [Burkholderiales bacterium]